MPIVINTFFMTDVGNFKADKKYDRENIILKISRNVSKKEVL